MPLPHSPLYRFSRTIAITDAGQDYNLNNSFNFLFGRRAAGEFTFRWIWFSLLFLSCLSLISPYSFCSPFLLLFIDQGTTTVLGYHTFNGGMTPTSTPQQYNPVIDMNNGDRCPIQATVSYNNDGKETF